MVSLTTKPTLSFIFSRRFSINPILSFPFISASSFTTLPFTYENAHLNQTPHFVDILLSLLEQSCKNLLWIRSIHSQVIVNSLKDNPYLATKLVRAYVELGHLSIARNVFGLFSKPEVLLCNAMINGYIKHELYNEALELFQMMDFHGLEIDDCTCTFAIKACTALSDYEFGMEIINRVMECGFNNNRFLGSSMINFLMKFDYVDEARRLFDEMRSKDVVCWNSMIGGYVKTSRLEEAIELFLNMRVKFKPSNVTMVSLIQACEGIGNSKLGKCVHGYVLGYGLGDNVMVLTSLINMYGKMGEIGCSFNVFNKMDVKTIVSWNVMISICVQNGYVSESIDLFRRLIYSGIKFDSGTIVSLLQGCSQTSDLNSGRIIHCHILRNNLDSNTILATTLLDLYSKSGALKQAYYIFNHIENKSVITWTALMVGLVQNGHAEEALRLYNKMQEEGVEANSVTLVSLIHSCAHLGSLKKGKSVHARLFRCSFAINVVNMTALVDMYSKCGKLNYAEKIFIYGSVYKDVILWNAMVTGYGIHGHGHKAMNMYDQMIDEGVKPNHSTFIALLSACSHSGLVKKGTDLFEKMEKDHNIKPLVKHYACVVDLFSRAGRLNEAEEFITKMPFESSGDVLEALLNGCRFHKNIDMAVKTADKLLCLNSRNPGIYIVLSNIYAEAKRWGEVDYIRELMRSRGLKKIPGYSAIEVDDTVHTFFASDDSHQDWSEINEVLRVLQQGFERSGYKSDLSCVLRDVDEEKKVKLLWGHSERLAIAFGILRTPAGSMIRVTKNLRVCNDCHNVSKYISELTQREIIVRDANRFHHFVNGKCSCGDYW